MPPMSRLRPAISETVEAPPEAGCLVPSEVPRLLWPSVEYGSSVQPRDLLHFPDKARVADRYFSGALKDDEKPDLYLRLEAFVSAVAQSVSCVLVLDPHFDEVGVEALGPALERCGATDIRLLTGGSKGDCERWRRRLESFRNWYATKSNGAQVYWKPRLHRSSFPFLHDRFAVVDGTLWHFGSTVGGGHRGLTAASGPWPEVDTQGKRFFEECWG